MQTPERRLQTKSYHAFRCIGADCEDTCCVGWNINVDRSTYQAYRSCEDPVLRPRLDQFVVMNPSAKGEEDYARITVDATGCPFLDQGLCSIQNRLGEQYLSNMCATYPRIMNVVDDVLERSLDLACPEAARIVLLDPQPMQFDSEPGTPRPLRAASLPMLMTSHNNSRKPYAFFQEIRALMIRLLQYRSEPLWKRLVILGSFCDQLQAACDAGRESQIPQLIATYRDPSQHHAVIAALQPPAPAAHLEMILELIVTRITSDYTSPQFLACYQEFMQGLEWTGQSTMQDLETRYTAALSEYYAPFMLEHDYMLEHYLVSYVFRSLFPLGPSQSQGELSIQRMARSIRDECQILLIHHAVIQALLIGRAALHKSGFSTSHAMRTIQLFAKTFEHSVQLPAQALELLRTKNINTCLGLAILLRF